MSSLKANFGSGFAYHGMNRVFDKVAMTEPLLVLMLLSNANVDDSSHTSIFGTLLVDISLGNMFKADLDTKLTIFSKYEVCYRGIPFTTK